jgi:hypothetical protein
MLSTQQALIHRHDRRTNPRQIASRHKPAEGLLIRCGTTRAGRARQQPTRLSNSAVSACCWAGGSCSPTFDATVTWMADALQPGTPTLLIKVDIPNPDGALQSGGLLHYRVKDLAQIAGADRVCLGDHLQSKRQAGALVKNGIVDLHNIAITTDHGTSVQVTEGSKTAARSSCNRRSTSPRATKSRSSPHHLPHHFRTSKWA